MQNGIFQTNWVSVGESVATAIFYAVLAGVASIALTKGFDVFATDWVMVGHNMLNVGVIAGVTTFANDFLSTNAGSFLGVGQSSTPNQ